MRFYQREQTNQDQFAGSMAMLPVAHASLAAVARAIAGRLLRAVARRCAWSWRAGLRCLGATGRGR